MSKTRNPILLTVFSSLVLFLFEGSHGRTLWAQTEKPTDSVRSGVRWGAVPIGNLTSDEGLEVGVLARRFDYGISSPDLPFESLLTLQTSYATRGPRTVLLEFEALDFGNSGFRVISELWASQNDTQPYYGLGPDSQRIAALEASGYYHYSKRTIGMRAAIRKQITSRFGLEFGVSPTYTTQEARPSDIGTAYESDFGTGSGSFYSTRMQLRVLVDRRDSEFIPSDGYLVSETFTQAPAFLGATHSWSRVDFDFRHYLNLIDRRRLWLATQFRFTQSSEAAPLTDKARLGSLGTLRGLPLSRYVSNDSMSLRGELRSVFFRETIWKMPLKLGLGVFVDSGRIADSFLKTFSGQPHTSWGLSAFGSYFTDDFLGSADIGFSEEGTAIYLSLGHAF